MLYHWAERPSVSQLKQMDTLITPVIVSTILTSILAPFLFYLLKRRDDNRRRSFDVRYAEYQKYQKTLDEISEAARINFEEKFLIDITDYFKRIMTNPQESTSAITDLNSSLIGLIKHINQTFTKSIGELHGLKLVCSDKLLEMIEEFIQLQREMLAVSSSILNNWQNLMPYFKDGAKGQSISEELKSRNEKGELLRKKILDQMRKELKLS